MRVCVVCGARVSSVSTPKTRKAAAFPPVSPRASTRHHGIHHTCAICKNKSNLILWSWISRSTLGSVTSSFAILSVSFSLFLSVNFSLFSRWVSLLCNIFHLGRVCKMQFLSHSFRPFQMFARGQGLKGIIPHFFYRLNLTFLRRMKAF